MCGNVDCKNNHGWDFPRINLMNLLYLLENLLQRQTFGFISTIFIYTHAHTQLISMKAKYRLKVAAVRRQWSNSGQEGVTLWYVE